MEQVVGYWSHARQDRVLRGSDAWAWRPSVDGGAKPLGCGWRPARVKWCILAQHAGAPSQVASL